MSGPNKQVKDPFDISSKTKSIKDKHEKIESKDSPAALLEKLDTVTKERDTAVKEKSRLTKDNSNLSETITQLKKQLKKAEDDLKIEKRLTSQLKTKNQEVTAQSPISEPSVLPADPFALEEKRFNFDAPRIVKDAVEFMGKPYDRNLKKESIRILLANIPQEIIDLIAASYSVRNPKK